MDIVCFFAQDPDEADDTAHQDVGDKLPGQLFSQARPGAITLSVSDLRGRGADCQGWWLGR